MQRRHAPCCLRCGRLCAKFQKSRPMPAPFRLVVRRSKSGRGLFTEERIAKGAFVIEYTGRPATAKQMRDNRGKYLFWTSATSMIDGDVPANLARFINHSCIPNCEVRIRNRRVYIYARRAIRPGEELSYDYGEEYFELHLKGICRCEKCTRQNV